MQKLTSAGLIAKVSGESREIVLNRLIKREDFTFNDILFEYENEVFK